MSPWNFSYSIKYAQIRVFHDQYFLSQKGIEDSFLVRENKGPGKTHILADFTKLSTKNKNFDVGLLRPCQTAMDELFCFQLLIIFAEKTPFQGFIQAITDLWNSIL